VHAGLTDDHPAGITTYPTSAQFRRAPFPGRCATSGRVIRVAAGGFLAGLVVADTVARRAESLYSNRHGDFGHFWPEVLETLHIGAYPVVLTKKSAFRGN
jgi:hypothetical protein